MPDELLSQEEIDALLSGMAKGQIDLDVRPSQGPEAIPYDLTSKSVILNDQFFALEEVFVKFTQNLQNVISTAVKKPLTVHYVSSEMVKYEEYIKRFASPTGFNLFTMDPLIGAAMVVVEPKLLFCLIDCMFGGDGRPLTADRELTVIDKRMMIKIVQETLAALERAWASIEPVRTQLRHTETRPEFVHLVMPDDYVITNAFEVGYEAFKGQICLCLSYLMLEPVKEKLSAAYLNKKNADRSWAPQLQRLIRATDVTVMAELGRTQLTIRELLDLKTNDVLKLDTGPEDCIRVSIENIAKFNGYPGILKGSRAVQITREETGRKGV